MNEILCIASTGCPWRYSPKDFPSVSTAQSYFHRWRDNGLWVSVIGLPVMTPRELDGRKASPTAGVIDSQSVKTTEAGGACGHDAGKRSKGRKRHFVVDALGLMVGLVVLGACVQDRPSRRMHANACRATDGRRSSRP